MDEFRAWKRQQTNARDIDRVERPDEHPVYMWYKAWHDKICPFVTFK